MRLKSVYISRYKNLQDFTLSFDNASFIDVFVGKNGSGKSNFFEALIEIFRHLSEFDKDKTEISFDYSISYEINNTQTSVEWRDGQLSINGRSRKTLGQTSLPDNVLIYYSGHNTTVAELVQRYEDAFRKRIKSAQAGESRRFIGIGPEYRALLLAALLTQPADNKARKFVCQKLGIKRLGIQKPGGDELTEPVIRMVLERPDYAKGEKQFDIELNDDTDRYWKPEGITRAFLERLTLCIVHTPGNLTVREGYFATDEQYILYIDVEKLQREFSDVSAEELFRQFDNLKTLGMLVEISVPLQLTSGAYTTAAHFSDGQLQSIYIYAIAELFKGQNCLTLLDEPDAFLHPEWQFEFLTQVFEITDAAATKNHVLMSSHSASTITSAGESIISLFQFDNSSVVVTKGTKSDVIRSLSSGLITFSEREARLSVHHVLENTNGAVLFTEGITDELILETAWNKLHHGRERPFEIQSAFDRVFLRNLFSRDELKTNFPGRRMFALFDFDEAYDDWNGLRKRQDEISDPHLGLAKQLEYAFHFAMLLPVPRIDTLVRQVLNADGQPWGRGSDSYLPIELLLYRDDWIGRWFRMRQIPGGGEIVEFFGDKVAFAKQTAQLDADCFEPLRPIFDFVLSKCAGR